MANKGQPKLKLVAREKTRLSAFPSVSSVLEDERIIRLFEDWSFPFVSFEVKRLVGEWKKKPAARMQVPSKEELVEAACEQFRIYERQLIQPVINATGMILHTNLGRAPISRLAYEELADAVTGYSNLEFDLIAGKRSNRSRMPGKLLAVLTGASAGMVVNNNAAAVYLIVAALAGPGREVIISRGQLVQIGGGFRIPEIIERSGAILREVGTTNKTSLTDYRRAVTKNTALILYVHKSNFIQTGFTEEPEPSRIAEMARKKKVTFAYDLGSGYFGKGGFKGEIDETSVAGAVRTGADLICFSGDKLLGGPQAGLIVGKERLIALLLKDPLYRAFRPDKLTLGLLENALLNYLRGAIDLPCWEMASRPLVELKKEADEICEAVKNPAVFPMALKSSFGGGSLPEYEFESFGLRVTGDPVTLSRRLLDFRPSIVCRSTAGGILLDLRTVTPEYLPLLTDAIKSCLS